MGSSSKALLWLLMLLIKLEITVILLAENLLAETPAEAPAGENWTCLPCFGSDVEMQRQESLMFGLPCLTDLGRGTVNLAYEI